MREGGSADVLGRIMNRSQGMLRASKFSVDIRLGRIIQRTTREITSGAALDDLSVERNVESGFGVVLCSERRWSVHSGMLTKIRTANTGIPRDYLVNTFR